MMTFQNLARLRIPGAHTKEIAITEKVYLNLLNHDIT